MFTVRKMLYRQTSKRFLHEISPFSLWTSINRLFCQELTISPIIFGETHNKSCCNRSHSHKNKLPICAFGFLNTRVTAATLLSNTSVQTVFKMITMTIWLHRQTWHFLITAVCHAKCMPCTSDIASIHNIGFFHMQFSNNCLYYILLSIRRNNSQYDWHDCKNVV